MDDRNDFLAAESDSAERDSLVRLAHRLEVGRPLPDPTFRGQLRRHLVRGAAVTARTPGLRRLALSCGASGLSLFAIAALSVLGAGPLAA